MYIIKYAILQIPVAPHAGAIQVLRNAVGVGGGGVGGGEGGCQLSRKKTSRRCIVQCY